MRVWFTGILLCFFGLFPELNAQVLINEIQSANVQTISDEFNEYPDWIELMNTSVSAVNLSGWCLSDDRANLTKWQLPAISLDAGQVILIYASGRNLSGELVFWQTVIDKGAMFIYLVPGDTVSANWNSISYNDINWPSGPSGFGFGDGDDATEIPFPVTSIYIRKKFTVADISTIKSMLLHVDYDDGFAAWLNGTEVARANLGSPGTAITYDRLADANREALMYASGAPELFDISSRISILQNGTNVLCMQVHNIADNSSDLTLIPFFTLGKSSVENASDKPAEILNLGTNAPHTNFKLKSAGEAIYLTKPSGIIADSMAAVAIPPDYSYGRLSGSTTQFGIFLNPTPGNLNAATAQILLPQDTVIFSRKGGYYQGSFSLTLSSPTFDVIYYTTDGSEPKLTSSVYTRGFLISGNKVVRARIIRDGFLPGKTYSRTYINDHKPDLPIICLSTDPFNLWDYNNGMYVMGPNAQSSEPNFGANFWMDWEKPVNVELYDPQGVVLLNQPAGGKIFGAWSRAREQKSFALFARKNYGKNEFSAQLFKQKDIPEFKSFIIRNGGNDWNMAFIRDGVITDMTSHLGVEHQAYQPVAAYLNGEYWGMYNMREKVNEDFLEANRGVNSKTVNLLELQGNAIEGDNTGYMQLVSFLESNTSLAASEKYSYVADRIDIDNFIKYQLVQIYIGNDDWPGNNIKYWNTTAPESKFRWILYDTEFSFGIYNEGNYSTNDIDDALTPYGGGWPNPPWSTLLFRRLVTNANFRNNFINQLADNANTTFKPSNINKYVDSISALVENEMVYHKIRWGQSYENWKYEVERIKSWGDLRSDYIFEQVRSTFSLVGQSNITLRVSDNRHGKIRMNSIVLKNFPFTGTYFKGVPVEIEAIPAPGYKFSHWEGDNSTSDRIIQYDPVKTSAFKAVFEPAVESDVSIVLNEINYNSPDNLNASDWIELYNNGNTTVDLSGYIFTDSDPDSGFVFPQGTILNTGDFLVVARNLKNFKAINSTVNNVIGEFQFGLSSDGDELRLYSQDLKVIDAVDYLPYTPWPEEANGNGPTLELSDPESDNGQPENWVAVKNGGTPGRKNSMFSGIREIFANRTNDSQYLIYPTRFNDYTSIDFKLNQSSQVKIDIVDLQGRIIETLANNYYHEGVYTESWIPSANIVSGIYLVRIITSENFYTQQIIYSKQ